MKRFWTAAEAAPRPPGYGILLDGKPLKLPPAGDLILPTPALAEAVAAEWLAAGGAAASEFTPDDLPLTRLGLTAQARIPAHRAEIVRQLAAYGLSDLLCYRDAEGSALAADEHAAWQPWLDWAAARYGVALRTGNGLGHVAQPPEAGAAFSSVLAGYDDAGLAGLGVIVPALGSLVLGLAVAEAALAPEEACRLASLDELAQEARWGIDAEALARRRAIAADVAEADRFMVLSRP